MRSPNGWTDNEICQAWFEHVFLPYAKSRRVSDDKPIVLTLDGHESHETTALRKLAVDNDIIMFGFPSKTTHKLQPLDVVVFSAVQRAWSSHCEEQLAHGVTIDRYNMIHAYLKVREVITPDLIKKSFAKTGICPFNPSIFTDEDFAPSMASSTAAHVPPSYPDEVPSSPPAVFSSDDEVTDVDSEYEPSISPDSTGNDLDESDSNAADVMMPDNENDNTSISDLPRFPPLSHNQSVPALLTRSLSRTPSNVHSRLFSPVTQSDLDKPDWQRSVPELIAELNQLRDSLKQKEAEIQAANAHCTIMKRALSDANTRVDNLKKKKTRGSTKVKARWIALPELKEAIYAEEAERVERVKQHAEKEAQKSAESVVRNARIAKDTLTRTFDAPLSSYKRKDDLVILAGTLEITTAGTVAVLTERVKEHLKSHPELANNQRFAGLFPDAQRRVNPPGPPLATTVITHQRDSTPHAPSSSLQPLQRPLAAVSAAPYLPVPPAPGQLGPFFPPNASNTPYAYRYALPQLTQQRTAPHSESGISSPSFDEASYLSRYYYTLPSNAGPSSELH